MAVPAARHADHHLAVGKVAMRQDEKHVFSLRRELEGDLARIAELEAQQARRLAGGDGSLHARAGNLILVLCRGRLFRR